MILKVICIIGMVVIVKNSVHCDEKMRRTVLGVGEWYYKILMTIGTCKDELLFSQQQIWGRVRMNRIFDIYYKSENENFKVSKVEIDLVVSDSDVMGYTKDGIGKSKFAATVYLPENTFVIFYSLKIYTGNVYKITSEQARDESKVLTNIGDVK